MGTCVYTQEEGQQVVDVLQLSRFKKKKDKIPQFVFLFFYPLFSFDIPSNLTSLM
jgi:hypothetical protein